MILGAAVGLGEAIALGVGAAQTVCASDTTDDALIRQGLAFERAGIRNVQLNAYCNLASTDPTIRAQNIQRVREAMRRADLAGARHVVVGGGHRDPDRPAETASAHPDNWNDEALAVLADSCQQVLSGLHLPSAPALVIETWVMTPVSSAERAIQLAQAVNHPHFGILFDPVNLMNLERYWDNGPFLKAFVDEVGSYIKLVHLKDTRLQARPITFQMAEVPIGTGHLDYDALLKALELLDVPLLIEHQASLDRYHEAVAWVRARSARLGFRLT